MIDQVAPLDILIKRSNMSFSDMLYENLFIRTSSETEPRDSEVLPADWPKAVKIALQNLVMGNLSSLPLRLNLTPLRSELSNRVGGEFSCSWRHQPETAE
jgi:hypothetical protein